MIKITTQNQGRREGGQVGPFAPGPQDLRGLITEDFNILTARNAPTCILSQSKWCDQENFPLASLGPHFPVLPHGSPKALGGPAQNENF